MPKQIGATFPDDNDGSSTEHMVFSVDYKTCGVQLLRAWFPVLRSLGRGDGYFSQFTCQRLSGQGDYSVSVVNSWAQ